MHPLSRIGLELGQLARTLSPSDFARYLGALVAQAPEVVRRRSFAPADASMNSTISIVVHGVALKVPLARIARALEGVDRTPTFGGVREMYAANVYLRAFRPDIRIENAVDLGANRGLFSLLAVKAYGARIAVGVEPTSGFTAVADALREANGVAAEAMPREVALVASRSGPDSISMDDLMAKHGLDSIDFIKCDIEGGEYDMMVKNNAFLSRVANIAMEVHPERGDNDLLVAELRKAGFQVIVADQFGKPDPRTPHYLYASRRGDLLPG